MRVVLLDAYNLLYRSFSSLPPSITGPDGEPAHAVYGMLNSILRLWRELQPDHMVAAFDTPETPTFRSDLYPAYQAHRGPLGGDHAPNFARQVSLARDVLPPIGVPAVSAPGFEADDIMGTLAVQVARAGGQATIVSTDRDLTQLVASRISIVVPSREPRVIASDDDVRSLLGVAAAGVTTFKALAGDPSDNIPGVRGVGRKGASDLVNRYQTLEAIYAALDMHSPRVSAALRAGHDDAFLFRTLVSIRTDVEVGLSVSELPPVGITDASRARQIIEGPES